MKGYEIVAYAYNAALHCTDCARDEGMDEDDALDNEWNEAHPIFASDDDWIDQFCDDCGVPFGE